MEQFIAPAMERIIIRSVGSCTESTRLHHNTASAAIGYQVELSEPTPNKPTSLGLVKFQQAKPKKEHNLPLSPSLEAWLTIQAQILEEGPTCMKALEVPPLLVQASDQTPERIAGRLSKFSGAWSEIGADP